MSSARLSIQNYCGSCDFRKKENGKTICSNSNLPINNAMENCSMLKPFRNYQEFKAKTG